MICPKCNRIYSDENVYCVECGSRLVSKLSNNEGNPMERLSKRVKTATPNENSRHHSKKTLREINPVDNKLDTIILQNKELIKQNYRIIELLEKITR